MREFVHLKNRIALFLFYVLGIFTGVHAQNNSNAEEKTISINVIVSGFKNSNGQAILNLFKTSDGFPGDFAKAYKTFKVKIVGNKVTFQMRLHEGVYAFSCVHDENKNGEMDKNIIGFPKEGAGLSNYSEKGYPSFNKAKILINNKVSLLTIKINYL